MIEYHKIKMKNLFIFISPDKKLPPEYDDLMKIQIDNSLELGWKTNDIVFAANFDYEYRGVKSIIVGDYEAFDQNRSTKIPAINELFRKDLIENDIYWFHDCDAFQLVPFEIKLEKDSAFTTHGGDTTLWNAGSFFFKKSAREIFIDIEKYMDERGTNEQNALTYMWENNINNINSKYEKLNITYNVGVTDHKQRLEEASKPVKVAHFHPHKKRHMDLYTSKNLLPDNLLKIFAKYGISI